MAKSRLQSKSALKAAGIIVKTNRKWRKGVYYSDAPKVNAQPLRSLKQDKYNKIIAITETAARNKLTKFGIIQSKASLVKKQCWKCHKTLKLQSDGSTLRCFSQTDGKKCGVWIYKAHDAFTPLWNARQWQVSSTCLLQAAYVVGLRLPQDTIHHLTNLDEKQGKRVYRDLLLCCAFAEKEAGDHTTFTDEIVDLDGVTTGIDRTSPAKTVFQGRFLGFKGRKTKKSAWVPLAPRTARKGRKNLTPERFDESIGPYTAKMGSGTLHMSDSSPGLLKCARHMQKPAGSVVHGYPKLEFAKPMAFRLSQLPEDVRRMALKKRPAALSATHLHTIAGNNAVEGQFGTAKQARSRMNLTGRRSSVNAHVNTLAAAYLTKKPGLDSVLRAIAKYRSYIENITAPGKAFGAKAELEWMWQSLKPDAAINEVDDLSEESGDSWSNDSSDDSDWSWSTDSWSSNSE